MPFLALILQSLHLDIIANISRVLRLVTTGHQIILTDALVLLRPTFAVFTECIAGEICVLAVQALADFLLAFRIGLDFPKSDPKPHQDEKTSETYLDQNRHIVQRQPIPEHRLNEHP